VIGVIKNIDIITAAFLHCESYPVPKFKIKRGPTLKE
jgi:hypothetical protein